MTLPVLLASAQGPSYGCCYNNTLVASPPLDPATSPSHTATPTASVQFSSSVVENGEFICDVSSTIGHTESNIMAESPFEEPCWEDGQ